MLADRLRKTIPTVILAAVTCVDHTFPTRAPIAFGVGALFALAYLREAMWPPRPNGA